MHSIAYKGAFNIHCTLVPTSTLIPMMITYPRLFGENSYFKYFIFPMKALDRPCVPVHGFGKIIILYIRLTQKKTPQCQCSPSNPHRIYTVILFTYGSSI